MAARAGHERGRLSYLVGCAGSSRHSQRFGHRPLNGVHRADGAMDSVSAMPARVGSASQAPHRPAWWPLLLAAGVCLAAMAWQHRFHLNLGDEGFLWYGAQRVLAGELPLRDFQSYDPGRYLWSAAWMRLLGEDGIVALRWSNTVLAAITVVLATWTIRSAGRDASPTSVVATGLILTLWMVPAYKVADSFAVVLLLLGLTRLLLRPTQDRYFQAGICWGLAAMIGINHGLYGAIGGLLTFLHLRGAPDPARAVIAAFGGAVLGYSPVLALHAFAPGFGAAFVDSISQLFEAGTTNFPLPLPNLFAILEVPRKGSLMPAVEAASALIFLCVPIAWASTAWRLRRPGFRAMVPPLVLAGLILSVPYAHYAYSRADPTHLAISILPVLAALLAYGIRARPVRRWLVFTSAFGVTLLITAHMHPGYAWLRGISLTKIEVGGDRLLVAPHTATAVRAVQTVANAAGAEQFFAGPYLPGAYAVAKRKAPVWEIYMIFPATPARQMAEVERIRSAGIRHALIRDFRWDYRADLGMAQTHPLVLAYLRKCLPNARLAAPELIVLTTARADRPCR